MLLIFFALALVVSAFVLTYTQVLRVLGIRAFLTLVNFLKRRAKPSNFQSPAELRRVLKNYDIVLGENAEEWLREAVFSRTEGDPVRKYYSLSEPEYRTVIDPDGALHWGLIKPDTCPIV